MVVRKIPPDCAKMHSYHSQWFHSLLFFLQFRCQQIGSLYQIREKPGYVRSVSFDPSRVDVWPRIRQSKSTLAFCSNPTSARFRVNTRMQISDKKENVKFTPVGEGGSGR